jgi:hypothetical protein
MAEEGNGLVDDRLDAIEQTIEALNDAALDPNERRRMQQSAARERARALILSGDTSGAARVLAAAGLHDVALAIALGQPVSR